MKKTIITTQLALVLLLVPAFAGNDKNNDNNSDKKYGESVEGQSPSFTYLALGDSVAFGMNITLLPPFSTQLPRPEQFVGYPEAVAAVEHLVESKKEVNTSCPGETSGSFLDTNALDYGCNSPHFLPDGSMFPPFKTSIGLHTSYTISQMEFAESQLRTNKHINLVTLGIGANDILLALPKLVDCGSDSTCAQNVLGPVLQSYAGNLARILIRIRAQYQRTLVLVTYYSPMPALDGVTVALNDMTAQVAAHLVATQPNFAAVKFADGFTAFQLASARFNHDACQAGLLVRLPASPSTPPCDIHPSPKGRDLLAAAVELAIRAGQ
jgi:lysophospholipase L1-like esterase